MPKIHATAVVDPKARISEDVEIGPLCVVGPNVTLGAGCKLLAQCHVTGHTTLGANNKIYPCACIGTDPEDYDFKGHISYLKIGDNNIFREGVTINVGTKPETETLIGSGCFFMANAHVAHNCKVGNKVILVVGAGISGYVEVGDNCLISGLSGVHQFCRIGRLAVLSGGSVISMDLPPFMIGEGRNGSVKTINNVGLKRNGFSHETIRALRDLCAIFFRSGLNVSNAIAKIQAELPPLPEIKEFIDFVKASKRGVLHGRDVARRL